MAPKITIVYFPIRGRAEPARLALEIAGIEYEDRRVPGAEFKETVKAQTTWGGLPWIEVDGKRLSQSAAIFRYIGTVAGLYPADAFESAKIDELIFALDDIGNANASTYREEDQEKKLAKRKEVAEGILKRHMGKFEEILQASSSGYLHGDKVSMADLTLNTFTRHWTSGMLDGIPTDWIDSFPAVKKHFDFISNIPQVKAFTEKHA
eukprot:GFYU01001322.1.p1 GENE.GFYU01001322.1~~GFYU01001322.1.p1  ORF type:complete len:207 (+),score=75.66 GFYU01001322.1:48-668(+)